MSEAKARVRARGTALCPDFAALERGVRRMIGRDYKEVTPGQWGWAPKDSDELVEKSREIAYALADGDLAAADEETAQWATSVARRPVKFEGAKAESKKEQTR